MYGKVLLELRLVAAHKFLRIGTVHKSVAPFVMHQGGVWDDVPAGRVWDTEVPVAHLRLRPVIRLEVTYYS